jgi:hypothetical protein
MFYPRGQPVYENLVTHFVRFDHLLEFLEEDYFSGYVELAKGPFHGMVFLENGEIIDVALENRERNVRKSGQTALSMIRQLGRARNGTVNVHRLAGEYTRTLSILTESETLYRNLSTEFSDMRATLAMLAKQRVTGHVEIHFSNPSSKAIVILCDGVPAECLRTRPSERVEAGIEQLNALLQESAERGAVFHIHRARHHPAPGVLKQEDSGGAKEIERFLDMGFQVVSSVLNRSLGAGVFERLFNETCLEMADRYPFLDPFAAEVIYRDGFFRIETEVELSHIFTAVSECLQKTLERVMRESGEAQAEVCEHAENAFQEIRTDWLHWQNGRRRSSPPRCRSILGTRPCSDPEGLAAPA